MIKGGYIKLFAIKVSSFFILLLFPALFFANPEKEAPANQPKEKTEATFYIAGDAVVSGAEHINNARIIYQHPVEKSVKKKSHTNASKKAVLPQRSLSNKPKKLQDKLCTSKVYGDNTPNSVFQKSIAGSGKYNRQENNLFFGLFLAQVEIGTQSLIHKEPVFTFQIIYSAKTQQNRIYIRAPGNNF